MKNGISKDALAIIITVAGSGFGGVWFLSSTLATMQANATENHKQIVKIETKQSVGLEKFGKLILSHTVLVVRVEQLERQMSRVTYRNKMTGEEKIVIVPDMVVPMYETF